MKPSKQVVDEVQEFYDTFPFPGRMVKTFNLPEGLYKTFKLWLGKNTLFHISNVKRIRDIYNNIYNNPRKILDAACGTGELPCLLAMAFPDAKIDACDLSDTNLKYANRLKSFLAVNNVHFFQYDLTSGISLESSENDLAICSGAIHHLSDSVKGLRILSESIQLNGRVVFGVYGRAFFREEYLLGTLRHLLVDFDLEAKKTFLKDFNITRQGIIRDIKRENKTLKHLSVLKGDFSYLGYELFPHNEDSLHMDGFCHPCVKYYDPDLLFSDVEKAGLEIEKFQNLNFPKDWLRNPFFSKLSLKDKFRFIDAYKLVPYVPVCKLKK